jgi:DNA transformation protein and related proteins
MRKVVAKAGQSLASGVAVGQLANLGPESIALLLQAGIDDRRKLEEFGAVGAYVEIHRLGLHPPLNLLYILEGALRNVSWTELPHHVRASITLEADALIESMRSL